MALILAVLVRTFLAQVYWVPSGSMENTLRIGDRILVEKVSYDLHPPRRGDIVVFDVNGLWEPETLPDHRGGRLGAMARATGRFLGLASSDTDYVKRVVGVTGDHVVCCDARGRVTVNGVALTEPYILSDDHREFDVVVPAGSLWVMGDHRDSSADSRAHQEEPGQGFVPVDRVRGRAVAVIWPPSHWSGLAWSGLTRSRPAGSGLVATVLLSPGVATVLAVLDG